MCQGKSISDWALDGRRKWRFLSYNHPDHMCDLPDSSGLEEKCHTRVSHYHLMLAVNSLLSSQQTAPWSGQQPNWSSLVLQHVFLMSGKRLLKSIMFRDLMTRFSPVCTFKPATRTQDPVHFSRLTHALQSSRLWITGSFWQITGRSWRAAVFIIVTANSICRW